MLYKHLFSILCGHLNLNKKRKKFEFDWLPIKPTGKPVKPIGKPVRTVCTAAFEFKFDFDPAGLAGPVGSVNPGQDTKRLSSFRSTYTWKIKSTKLYCETDQIRAKFIASQPGEECQDTGRNPWPSHVHPPLDT